MPAFLGPLIGFALGVAFAWVSVGSAGRDRLVVRHRGALLSAAYGLLIFAPACGYFIAFAPDWSVAYWFDGAALLTPWGLVWVLLDASAPALGFLLATRNEHAKPSFLIRLASGPALLALGLLVLSYRRLGVYGTYRQVHGDFGVHHVGGTPLGHALLWMLPVLVLGTVWTLYCMHNLSRGAPIAGRSRRHPELS
ncbi:MAG: hypothetical protein KC766_10580 [Myxococcales bacterium]|nr:hypothetical protein [Myxococcales bacterium]MCB1174207.1 hypothetical protein [Leptospiraceae bacterium]